MAYKFSGRIKKFGYEQQGADNFCEFDVDNTIKIGDKEQGVAFDGNNNLQIVPIFIKIDDSIFNVLLSCHDERFEIEYDDKTKSKNQEDTIIKVTVLK